MRNRKLLTFAIVILAILPVLLIPFETVFVPEWRLRLVNEKGEACPEQVATQYCTNYTLGIHPCELVDDQRQVADRDGFVTFPARKLRASMSYRIARPVIGLGLLVLNGEYGTNGSIITGGPCGSGTFEYEPGQTLPDHIVISKSRN